MKAGLASPGAVKLPRSGAASTLPNPAVEKAAAKSSTGEGVVVPAAGADASKAVAHGAAVNPASSFSAEGAGDAGESAGDPKPLAKSVGRATGASSFAVAGVMGLAGARGAVASIAGFEGGPQGVAAENPAASCGAAAAGAAGVDHDSASGAAAGAGFSEGDDWRKAPKPFAGVSSPGLPKDVVPARDSPKPTVSGMLSCGAICLKLLVA